MTAIYLLAKYIPDLHRFEPRNIGVIVWTPTGVQARFLAEHPSRQGDVDGRSIPKFVTSANAYKQWLSYWRNAVSGRALSPVMGGAPVNISDQAFVETLKQSGHGNFVLVEGGALLDSVSESELPIIADQLFSQLVEASGPEQPSDPGFELHCDELLDRTGLKRHPHFVNHYPVRCRVHGVDEEYEFSHALANGTLERLYQRFPIPKRKQKLQKSRDATAWMLESLASNRIIAQENVVLLVDTTSEQQAETEVDKTLRLLGSMSRIINIHNESEALAEFGNAALLPVH